MSFKVPTESCGRGVEGTGCQDAMHPPRGLKCLALVVLFLAVSLMFACSIPPRRSWFGTMGLSGNDTTSELLLPISLRLVGEWLGEPALSHLRFPTYESPRLALDQGERLDSAMTMYFPLFFMPLYLPAKILGTRPTVAWAMVYGLLVHWLVALLGAALVFSAVLSAARRLMPALRRIPPRTLRRAAAEPSSRLPRVSAAPRAAAAAPPLLNWRAAAECSAA